jgi:hypothetical protein
VVKNEGDIFKMQFILRSKLFQRSTNCDKHLCVKCANKIGIVLPEATQGVNLNDQLIEVLEQFVVAIVEEG